MVRLVFVIEGLTTLSMDMKFHGPIQKVIRLTLLLVEYRNPMVR